ncbi:sigma-54 dependent transcriptional regulator [Lacibacter sp. H375]|uniref:sigma-54-dependent transcriptional regulator n=1 Tax=Lacibacter sp. H375 TaxID=3133424 RepID=UPI0030C3C33D
MNGKILIIDDDTDLCTLLVRFLKNNGFEAEAAYSGNKGLAAYTAGKFDVVICDYRLGDMDGIKLVSELKQKDPHVAIIVITAYSVIKTAVEIIKMGAYDYLVKPLIPDEVLKILKDVLNRKNNNQFPVQANGENTSHAHGTTTPKPQDQPLPFYKGHSKTTVGLYNQVDIVAGTNYSVLLYGESGTGKEVIARTIHQQSQRANKPFVALDCGTLSKELAGSELFGHTKGSFTGALLDKEGHFEMANGGTLFLDEIGNLSLEIQASLLRVIQERKYKRIGGSKEMPVDVRIIVASNENLKEAYQTGKFREDLYHRLNEFPIHLPALRDRRDDIIPLAEYFLQVTNEETNRHITGFTDEVKQMFLDYSWPGNLRECRNTIRRAVLLTPEGQLIKACSLPEEMSGVLQEKSDLLFKDRFLSAKTEVAVDTDQLKSAVNKAEFETILAVLQQVNFNKKKAAEILKIDRKTLYNKLKHLHNLQSSS